MDLAVVPRVARLRDEAVGLHAVDEADGAVVLDLEAGGEVADGEGFACVSAADDEHSLVLLGRDAGGEGGLLTEMEEVAEGVAGRAAQMAVIGSSETVGSSLDWAFGFCTVFLRIVLRYEKIASVDHSFAS